MSIRIMTLALLGCMLAACQPTDKPANLANTKALDKAKSVEGQMQQRAEEPRKSEEEQK
jgi:hypothetical protein